MSLRTYSRRPCLRTELDRCPGADRSGAEFAEKAVQSAITWHQVKWKVLTEHGAVKNAGRAVSLYHWTPGFTGLGSDAY